MMLRGIFAIGMLLTLPIATEARGGGGSCNVCGCKGGPGYRAPDGKCVGHRNIKKMCGVPPTQRCKKESANTSPTVAPSSPRTKSITNPFS